MSWASEAIYVLSIGVIIYFAVLNGCYLIFTAIAWREIVRHLRRRNYIGVETAFASPLTPPVSVILPAFNEETWIVDSVRALLRLRYPTYEIIVVDDGSTDATVARLREAYGIEPAHLAMRSRVAHAPVQRTYRSARFPHLTVVTKTNEGTKADALNAGINAARYPYVCLLDADQLVEPDGLLRIARPLLDDPEGIVGAAGIVRIANGCEVEDGAVVKPSLPQSRLATLQIVEYFRAFVAERVAWSRLGSLMIVSGAFGLFERRTVESVGGYEPGAIGEDLELVQRLYHVLRKRREPCRIVYVPEVVVWTEVPEDRRGLAGQRRRWQRGLFDTIRRHRGMISNPRFGAVGMVGMPFCIVFELLGPVVELLGYLLIPIAAVLGVLDVTAAIVFAIVALLLGALQSVAALLAVEFSFRRLASHREALRLIAYAFVDNLGYRQWLAFWRVWALVDIAARRSAWGTIPRQGTRPGEQASG